MKHVEITSRLRQLARDLERDIDDLGYQGITDTERESATVLDALLTAIEVGSTAGLAATVRVWLEEQERGGGDGQG